jgi:hypothetical protein
MSRRGIESLIRWFGGVYGKKGMVRGFHVNRGNLVSSHGK